MKNIKSFIVKIALKRKTTIFIELLKKESLETKEAYLIIKEYIKTGVITKENDLIVKQQFYDVLKLAGIGIPFFLIPGASILLPIVIKVAKKKNIELLPSSFALHSTMFSTKKLNFSQEAIDDITNIKGLKE